VGTSLSSLVPELQPFARALVDLAGQNGLHPRVTSARRSYLEQRSLYNRFLRGANPFPVAAPGTSSHETGEAFDMVVTPVDYLTDLGRIWQEWGGTWGGDRDPVHFQLPGAPTAALLEQLKGQAPRGTTETISEWLLREYESIPWWISLFLPANTTMQSAAKPYTQSLIRGILAQGQP